MCVIQNRCLPALAGIIGLLSLSAILINYFLYKFPSNNYFPDHIITFAVILLLFYLGLIVLFGPKSRISYSGRELLYFFSVMCLIALATNAVQLTPFVPIDNTIVSLESLVHINMSLILIWTKKHPHFKEIMTIVYNSLTYQMCFLPLFAIIMGKFNLLKEYYFLMLFTVLTGFVFYYFFPTTAPASVIKSSLFSQSQIATSFKFNQIHHYIIPTTTDGGLIALPSFHTIWALLCIYLLKDWPIFCIPLMVINSVLIASCVLLGWHYPTDVLSGIILVLVAFYLLSKCKSNTLAI